MEFVILGRPIAAHPELIYINWETQLRRDRFPKGFDQERMCVQPRSHLEPFDP